MVVFVVFQIIRRLYHNFYPNLWKMLNIKVDRDAFRKKNPYGGTLSQPHITPSPPLQKEGQKGHFLASRPPSPFKSLTLLNFCTYQEMIFKETIFNHLLFTLSKYAKMAYKLQKK